MNVSDYIILAVIITIAVLIVFGMVRRKKKNKGSCGNCSGCPCAGECSAANFD